MSISTKKEQGLFTEINITPLTDIFLVLLIIMMVVAPMFQNIDQSIKIPEINSGISVGENKVVVSVTERGELFVNKIKSSSEKLVQDLIAAKNASKEKTIVLQADQNTKNKDIMNVMRSAQAAGYVKLTVAGEPLAKSEQKELQKQWNEKNKMNKSN